MFDFCTLPWNEYPDRYRSIELIAVYTSLSSPPPPKKTVEFVMMNLCR
jgi:hypothetical protein